MKIFSELRDHLRRSLRALAGFEVFGVSWLRIWIAYFFSPLLSRVLRPQEWNLGLCRIRTKEGDAYTFANVFEDYPADRVRLALREVEQVIDAGANVGAFSLLACTLAGQLGCRPRIISIEPMEDNVALLRRQPFAGKLTILPGALGPTDGQVSMLRGINSVTHQADFTSQSGQNRVPMHSLAGLCDRPTLLKMDIEGGEHAVLSAGLPPNVRSLFLEWHPVPGQDPTIGPDSLIPHGRWELISRDLYGSSMWFWQATEKP